MKPEDLAPFTEATMEIVQTMANLPLEAGTPYLKEENPPQGELSGVIGLVGEQLIGGISIIFPEKAILRIASGMLYEEFTEIDDDVSDCVGEITNMLCGGVKKRFGERGFSFNMTQPSVVRGVAHVVFYMTHCPITVQPFSVEGTPFYVECFLGNVQGLKSKSEIYKRISSAY